MSHLPGLRRKKPISHYRIEPFDVAIALDAESGVVDVDSSRGKSPQLIGIRIRANNRRAKS